ncbi:MAG: sulfatase, partial [Prevotella sp.]|nr:sulfatase [Prevotella sp.]
MKRNQNKSFLPVMAASLMVTNAMAQTDKRPNILYIMSDDHAYQAISAYGSDVSRYAPTPNIDRIAREGMRFDRSFVENSLSSPSRACLITGLYSHQNGQQQLLEGIDSTRTFFSELLQQVGYQTAMMGKWHLLCRPKGFDRYHVLNDQGTYFNPVFMSETSDGKYIREEGYATDLITDHAIDFLEHRDTSRPFCLMVHHKAPHRSWFPDVKHLGMYDNVDFPLPETLWDDYSTRGSAAHTQKMQIDRDMELALDLKVDSLGRPVDRFNSTIAEYGRLNPEQRAAYEKYFGARYERFQHDSLKGKELVVWKYQTYLRDYLSVIHSVDENVGRLLKYLDEHGLAENTIVVYASDQGFYMGEHGWFDKRFMYEESMRTPLVIRYPREIRAGSVSSEMVQNIDYAPTFLEYAGVKQPKEMTGRSLRKLFKHTANNSKKIHWRKSLYYHYYDYPAWHLTRKHDGVRTDRYKLIHFYGKGGARALTENRYQQQEGTREYNSYRWMAQSGYITDDPDIDYYELYDLQEDPNELNNIYGKPGTERITKRLKRLLKRYRKELAVK